MNHIENRVQAALAAIAKGQMVIVADDDDREAEGDFVMAAELIRAEDVNLMAARGRGLICAAIDEKIAQRLNLTVQSGALHSTAFTESLDYRHGTTTGISCEDRAIGLRMLANPQTVPNDYARPGHIFPLVARSGGVRERRGHTEAAVDLCRLAGLTAAGVICEIMNPDGSMARTPQLCSLAEELGVPFLTVDDLALWREAREKVLTLGPGGRIPTEWGEFNLYTLSRSTDPAAGVRPLLLCYGFDPAGIPDSSSGEVRTEVDNLLVRIHSECVTGDLFGSLRCDCGAQLHESMRRIVEAGMGAVIYLRQEGRGIGLDAKLRAYALQDGGMDTVDANLALGLPADARNYDDAVAALRLIGCHSVRLLTNNPAKVIALEAAGIRVAVREPLHVGENSFNHQYIATKVRRMGHEPAGLVLKQ